ncbi:MAG: hypothetical protein BWY26_01417 [Elusimicrobia bacterium ADurb.Bin231]|nr:MAG: hypothetical protein BWY26_01417 [Elusimicrobia bacterium ADurb.Bin231]
MVELALHIPGIRDITFLENVEGTLDGVYSDIPLDPSQDDFIPLPPVTRLFGIVLKPLLGKNLKFNRVYFGAEFCQCLIPSLEHLTRIKKLCEKKELKFTFVTPYVTDFGIKQLVPIFSYLNSCDENIEVVVNDYGILNLISRDYPRLLPILGRCMNKMERDPRFAKKLPAGMIPGQLRVWQETCLTLPYYKRILGEMGVKRFEFDIVPQGIKTDFSGSGFSASLYYPWTFVTTGRVCETGSLSLEDSKKFRLDVSCAKECREYFAYWVTPPCECNNKCETKSAKSSYIFQVGNTIFMLCEAPADVLRELFSRGFDRVVYEPGLPL